MKEKLLIYTYTHTHTHTTSFPFIFFVFVPEGRRDGQTQRLIEMRGAEDASRKNRTDMGKGIIPFCHEATQSFAAVTEEAPP